MNNALCIFYSHVLRNYLKIIFISNIYQNEKSECFEKERNIRVREVEHWRHEAHRLRHKLDVMAHPTNKTPSSTKPIKSDNKYALRPSIIDSVIQM